MRLYDAIGVPPVGDLHDEATWRGLVERCPALGRQRWWLRIGAREPGITLSARALKQAARSLKKSSALYLQPHHLRVIAISEGGVAAMLPLCERLLSAPLRPLTLNGIGL